MAGTAQDLAIEEGAYWPAELLGIVQGLQGREVLLAEPCVVETDRGGDQWARQAASTGLIGAGDSAAGAQPEVEVKARVR